MLSCVACTERQGGVSVPKPRGYARIELCDSVYQPVTGVSLRLEVNRSAVVTHDDSKGWVDVAYPAYGGVLHLTVKHIADSADLASTLAQRYERMMLNLGDNSAEQIEITATKSGAVTTMLASQGTVLTPLQILSVCRGVVVSGAFSFNHRPESADSVAPIVAAVKRDLIHTAKCLE